MVFVSFILFVAVIIVFFEDKNVARYGLRLSFLLITIIFSLRYDYGNDYFNYIDTFKEINRHTTIKTAIENTNVEFGWTIICRLLCHFNPQIIISLSTIVQ